MYSYQKHLYGLFSPYLIERKKETFKKFYDVQSESVNIVLNILSSIIFNHLNGNEKVGGNSTIPMCSKSALTTFVRFLTYRRETRQALGIRDNVVVDLDVGCKKVSDFYLVHTMQI